MIGGLVVPLLRLLLVVVLLLLVGTTAGFFIGAQIGTGFEPERNMKIGAAVGCLAGLLGGGWLAGFARRPRD
jgi:hypothetical protein